METRHSNSEHQKAGRNFHGENFGCIPNISLVLVGSKSIDAHFCSCRVIFKAQNIFSNQPCSKCEVLSFNTFRLFRLTLEWRKPLSLSPYSCDCSGRSQKSLERRCFISIDTMQFGVEYEAFLRINKRGSNLQITAKLQTYLQKWFSSV